MRFSKRRAGAELKLDGARRLTLLAWHALKDSKGSVGFLSGSAALDPKPPFAAVAAINAAIIAQACAKQGIQDGVEVNGVCSVTGDDGTSALVHGQVGRRITWPSKRT